MYFNFCLHFSNVFLIKNVNSKIKTVKTFYICANKPSVQVCVTAKCDVMSWLYYAVLCIRPMAFLCLSLICSISTDLL